MSIAIDVCDEPKGGVLLKARVADTGIGIADAARARLFKTFSQADASTARRYGGSGLGLAICKRIVERMGGEIGFESREGEGSVFWFNVRLAVAGRPSPDEPRKAGGEPNTPKTLALDPAATRAIPDLRDGADAPTAQSLRILVVDDNFVNHQVAVGLLNKLGHRTDVADDGDTAVELVARGDYDMVLMDMQMPRVDGLTATGLIRRLPAPRNAVPIVALTANAMAGDREICLSAGMDDYLSKPIGRRQIGEMLDRQRKRSTAEAGRSAAGLTGAAPERA